MKEIIIQCCEGQERHTGQCLREKCPIYADAAETVDRNWPYLATGFGNAYGYPKHRDNLIAVQNVIAREESEPDDTLEIKLERTPRGRKKHRTSEIIAKVPSVNGAHELNDGSIISTSLNKNRYGTSVTVKAEGPVTQSPYLHILQEGVAVTLSPSRTARYKLTGTKSLVVEMGKKGRRS